MSEISLERDHWKERVNGSARTIWHPTTPTCALDVRARSAGSVELQSRLILSDDFDISVGFLTLDWSSGLDAFEEFYLGITSRYRRRDLVLVSRRSSQVDGDIYYSNFYCHRRWGLYPAVRGAGGGNKLRIVRKDGIVTTHVYLKRWIRLGRFDNPLDCADIAIVIGASNHFRQRPKFPRVQVAFREFVAKLG